MGFHVSGPEVVAFLEWMRANYPEHTSFRALGRRATMQLVRSFVRDVSLPDVISEDPDHVDLSHVGQNRRLRRSDLQRSISDDILNARSGGQWHSDRLARYLRVPFHAVFLYTSQDLEFGTYYRAHWQAWSDESADAFDFYDYAQVDRGQDYSYSQDYIRRLRTIPGADTRRILAIGLPCMLVWSDADHALIPFADISDHPMAIRDRFRLVRSLLSEGNIDALRAAFSGQVAAAVAERDDVFISYAHADRTWVIELHDALEREGHSVWFDDHLRAGDRFDLRILHHLNHAMAAVVVWSQAAIRSDWVKAEALLAYERKRFIPVSTLWPIEVPPPFNAVQTTNLSSWPSNGTDAFSELLAAIEHKKRLANMT